MCATNRRALRYMASSLCIGFCLYCTHTSSSCPAALINSPCSRSQFLCRSSIDCAIVKRASITATSASIPLSRGERFSSLRSCSSFAEHENWQQWPTHLSNSKCSRDAHGAQTTRHSLSRNRRNPHHISATPTHAHSAALHQQSAGEPHHESADKLAVKPANHPQTQASKASAPPIARMAHTLR